jgi:hypothetical protein
VDIVFSSIIIFLCGKVCFSVPPCYFQESLECGMITEWILHISEVKGSYLLIEWSFNDTVYTEVTFFWYLMLCSLGGLSRKVIKSSGNCYIVRESTRQYSLYSLLWWSQSSQPWRSFETWTLYETLIFFFGHKNFVATWLQLHLPKKSLIRYTKNLNLLRTNVIENNNIWTACYV